MAIQQAIQQAAKACEAHHAQNLQRMGSGTGDILRTNFLVVVDTVVEHDGSLLVQDELNLLDTFKVVCPRPAPCPETCFSLQAEGNCTLVCSCFRSACCPSGMGK